jgi:predicted DCC family thiol-disulfide oxidoreductase YuxK
MSVPALTLYYDGNCPFCSAEMRRLRSWDRHEKLVFVDITVPDFNPACLGVGMAELNREIYSKTADGKILVGIDTMLAAYTLVGKGWLAFPLRAKTLRPLLTTLYRKFARNRYRMSRLLGYAPAANCDTGVCRREHPFLGE